MEGRLREARIAAGLSQAAVAGAAGVSRQAVGAIEAGLHRPSVDAALAVAAAVGQSVEELFGAAEPRFEPVLGPPAPDGTAVLAAACTTRRARRLPSRAGRAPTPSWTAAGRSFFPAPTSTAS